MVSLRQHQGAVTTDSPDYQRAISAGISADKSENVKDQRAISRVAENLIKHLRTAGAGVPVPGNDLRKKLRSTDREYFDAALALLEEQTKAERHLSENRGPEGFYVYLLDEDWTDD